MSGIQNAQTSLHLVAFSVVVLQRPVVFHQLLMLLLEIFDIVVVSKSLRCYKINVFLRFPKLLYQIVSVIRILDCEDRVGRQTSSEGKCEKRIRIVHQQTDAQSNIESDGKYILREHF